MKHSLISRLLVISLFSSVLLSCEHKEKIQPPGKGKSGKAPVPKVAGFVVAPQTIDESIEVPGSLTAEEATEIHPEVAGRITNLYIKEGAIVNKGAVLAKLYDGDLQAQRRKLEVQLQIAQQTQNRHEQLLKIGGISKEDYNTSALQVSNTRADLDIVRTEIDKTVIRAPFSGKIGLKQVSPGAYVTTQSVLATIQKNNALRVDFNVPEKYISQMTPGRQVSFTIDGSDRTYTATIMATESGIEQASRTLTMRARVTGNQTGLLPGGFAKVKLAFDPNPNALMVPTQAVIPQARGKQVALYQNGKANFVEVTTGVRDSARVEITSGLKPGDTVIVTGLMSLKPDAKVTVNKITTK